MNRLRGRRSVSRPARYAFAVREYPPRRVVRLVAASVWLPTFRGGDWLPQPRARSPLSVRPIAARRNPARRRGRRGVAPSAGSI